MAYRTVGAFAGRDMDQLLRGGGNSGLNAATSDAALTRDFRLHEDSRALLPQLAVARNDPDPAALVRARDEGADEAEIHRRAYAGEFEAPAPLDLRLP